MSTQLCHTMIVRFRNPTLPKNTVLDHSAPRASHQRRPLPMPLPRTCTAQCRYHAPCPGHGQDRPRGASLCSYSNGHGRQCLRAKQNARVHPARWHLQRLRSRLLCVAPCGSPAHVGVPRGWKTSYVASRFIQVLACSAGRAAVAI